MTEPVPISFRDDLSEESAQDTATDAEAPAGFDLDAAIELMLGVVTIGADALLSALRSDPASSERAEGIALLIEAGAGFVIEATRTAGTILSSLERTIGVPAGEAIDAATDRVPGVRELLEHWGEALSDQREQGTAAVPDAFGTTVRRATDAVLDQLDLTEIVREHVDIQAIAGDLDMNTLVGQLDMNSLTDRIDMDRLSARIDIDALVARLDIDAVLDRVDMIALASAVIDELDFAQLVRDATSDTASDGIRTVRLRGVDADRALRRAVDRVLARRETGGGDR